jgi:hypothetical protein
MTTENQTTAPTFEIVNTTLAALNAIAATAAVSDIRFYLKGVYFEANSTSTRLVSTDGHCLGIYQSAQPDNKVSGAINFIMPADIIKMLKPAPKSYDEVTITIARNSTSNPDLITGGTIQAAGGAVITWGAIDAKYPDYIRVLPKGEATGEAAHYHPSIVQKFVKAAKLLSKQRDPVPAIVFNGHGGALVDIGVDNYAGVIMPCRVDPAMSSAPGIFLNRLA